MTLARREGAHSLVETTTTSKTCGMYLNALHAPRLLATTFLRIRIETSTTRPAKLIKSVNRCASPQWRIRYPTFCSNVDEAPYSAVKPASMPRIGMS